MKWPWLGRWGRMSSRRPSPRALFVERLRVLGGPTRDEFARWLEGESTRPEETLGDLDMQYRIFLANRNQMARSGWVSITP